MTPQAPAVIPGQPIAPVANNVNPQGTVTPPVVGAPTPQALPSAPAPVATPQVSAIPQATNNLPSALNDIANYYQIPRQTAVQVGAGAANASAQQSQFEAQKYQRQIQIQNQQQELSPSGYTINNNPNSPEGVTITNVLGQPVSLGTYVNLTGANPAEVLQNSTNPQAQKFVEAYNNFENYVQTQIAAQKGSVAAQSALADYYQQNPGLKGMQLGQLQSMFMNTYGQYFGVPQSNQNGLGTGGTNATLQSTANPVTASAYENPVYNLQNQSNPYQTAVQGAAGGSTSQILSALNSTPGS